MIDRFTKFLTELRADVAAYDELIQRRAIKRRPWTSEVLHWHLGEDGWELHGRVANALGKEYGATTSGWCNCSDSQRSSAPL